ncbi:DUF4328 domain-containing protein [Candidatus Obscuribacterales bacterium]|nr:DUF4328 domain-containing protein [Candidatus Obscuribacterales bacterium]MBX3152220.1 DUF4328 domain-containing protein [Candidatus Obscuribacterales bacterium]
MPFIIWTRRVFRNLKALGVEGLSSKEWYCIWSWFIPIACYILPIKLMHEIWKANVPRKIESAEWSRQKNSVLVTAWATTWLCYAIPDTLRVLLRLKPQTGILANVQLFMESSILFTVLLALSSLSKLLMLKIVGRVTEHQKQMHSLRDYSCDAAGPATGR